MGLPPPTTGQEGDESQTGIPQIHAVPIAGGAGLEIPGESSPQGLRVTFPPCSPCLVHPA